MGGFYIARAGSNIEEVSMIRLFERTADGLLVEVAPSEAKQRYADGTVSRISLEIDVLWTDDEIAARDAEDAAQS